jgi:butyrate kinase
LNKKAKDTKGVTNLKDLFKILVVNPGSTSTKTAVYNNEKAIFENLVRHDQEELAGYSSIIEQYDFRERIIMDILDKNSIDIWKLDAVVGRGGLTKPVPGGTYYVNQQMLNDLKSSVYGQHASSLGAIIAYGIAEQLNIPSFVVDPVVVDELEPVARISGIPEIRRRTIFHALNQKAVARRAAKEIGKSYEELNFIVAHMGGGITVGAHRKGKVIDVNNALDGEGPFTPERSGALPVMEVIKLCFSGEYTQEQLTRKIAGEGGLMAYLGTNDGCKVNGMILNGHKEAEQIYHAMAYQVAKEIGSMGSVLCGAVDAVLLTGGLAHDQLLVGWIKDYIDYIAPVFVYPGEDEMSALAEGALRVLRGVEKAKEYI